ncbi:MAG: hypothetical protein JSW61_03340 [Candidatus Thorarchaeota archaeon]|nr:MAG: hypothetical protein JSW61_03340 [Candidatus Thorarchaeota archaeon]
METSSEFVAKTQESNHKRGVGHLLRILGYALVWAFLISLTVGSFAAAIWTAIPTDLLAWGSTRPNLLGYVSHCSFVPLSTAILSVASVIGLVLTLKLKRARRTGQWVLMGVVGGMAIGLLGGIDIEMFIGMGAGVGIGVALAIVVEVIQLIRGEGVR